MTTLHMVRHGEVHNPDHLVYSDLPGFGLSRLGRDQAAETAHQLADRDVARVVASPLQRAIETAGFIAARHGLGVVVDDRLTEWRLAQRWAGLRWEEVEKTHPGELTAYLADPADLPFAVESLAALGARVAQAASEHITATGREVVVVSHQDPIHAGIRTLTGAGLDEFNTDKPDHATVVSLESAGPAWRIVGRFDPAQGDRFPPEDG